MASQQNYIQWNDSLTIDEGVIDDDHRYLIDLSNQFIRFGNKFENAAQAKELTNLLKDYALAHFRREEDLQAQIGFPDHEEHKKAHAELEENLSKIKGIIDENAGVDLQDVSQQVSLLLRRWLLTHILKHDIEMRQYAPQIRAVSAGTVPLKEVAFL